MTIIHKSLAVALAAVPDRAKSLRVKRIRCTWIIHVKL